MSQTLQEKNKELLLEGFMRIKDGLFVEHWDVIQPEATKEF